MKQPKRTSKRTIAVYKSYNFVNKDPAIDIVRTMVQMSKKKLAQIHADGGPTVSCLRKWFDGGTKRPQHCTLVAAAKAVGGDYIWLDPQGNPIMVKEASHASKVKSSNGNRRYQP